MTTDEKVISAEDILNNKSGISDTNTKDSDSINKKSKKIKTKKEKSLEEQIPKGKPKSGRIWKEQKKRFVKKNKIYLVIYDIKFISCYIIFINRFSSIVKTRGIRLSFDKKQKLKEDLKHVKEMSREIKAKKQAEKEAKKERRRANLKRAAENQRKSEIVQVVSIFD